MSSHLDWLSTPQSGATKANILSRPMSKGLISFGPLYEHAQAWRKVVRRLRRQPQIASTTTVIIISSKTTSAEMPAIRVHKNLSAEDREAREKGLALATRIERLYRTDQGFRRWYHEGIDEIEAGHFVIFSEGSWKEE